ncbi:MAG: hypothetical protein HY531_03380 [Chloroflexi bacterium]|nr:hypothetical protein [Chloroflexota bacterium]
MTTQRLLEVEYRKGDEIVVRLRPHLLKMVPQESLRHWRNSNRELLLAVRSLLDKAIERMEPGAPDAQGRRGRRRQRVEVKEEKASS